MDALTLANKGPGNRLTKIRRAIAELQIERGNQTMRRRLRGHAWHGGRTTSALFRSTSSKFADNVVPTLVAGQRGIHDKADTFADAWEPIFNQGAAADTDVATVLTGTKANSITHRAVADEVAAVVDACAPGKACGPDTNYRPLALLKSDYNIFTRILATRISKTLSERTHSHQKGFVPGRQIHDTIDLFTAAQQMANVDPKESEALAMLLDFQKASDSLDRTYLIAALKVHGYSAQFIQAVEHLHTGTEEITSVRLMSSGRAIELKIGGFADVTAVYLHSAVSVPCLRGLTSAFSKAIGVHINKQKVAVIALRDGNPNHRDPLPGLLQLRDHTKFSRYLGAQVGSRDSAEYTWNLTVSQLATRLRLASD
ncbi:hypothetical protein ON010_g12240 [Phytophthora cinnamomi]|nr:hypothetical protein ON010_g12240 [Phytophthora cinnamomi]